MTLQYSSTQLTDAELLVLKLALTRHTEDSQEKANAESTLHKLNYIEENCKLYGCHFIFGIGEPKELFSIHHGSKADGLVWAIQKGLTPIQASKLYDKVVNASPNAKQTERRKMFIDEVEFYLDF